MLSDATRALSSMRVCVQDMAAHITKKLQMSLPGNLAALHANGDKDLNSMMQINWTKPGTPCAFECSVYLALCCVV
eukprot:1100422-Amphidinium_carterae.2